MEATDVVTVFVVGLATALATGLGAIPLLFTHTEDRRTLGLANAAAAGVMTAASVGLVLEGADRSTTRVALGVAAGVVFILLVARYLHAPQRAHDFGSLRGDDAVKGMLIVAVMTVHSVAEGVGVGAAFGGGQALGLVIGVAIAVHNIPEGLAISLVLVPRGASVRAAAGWSIFSSLPQALVAVPAYLFVESFEGILPVALGFAAGAMAWMVVRELLPDAVGNASTRGVVVTGAVAFAAMLTFQLLLV